jgi:hypothetical protein
MWDDTLFRPPENGTPRESFGSRCAPRKKPRQCAAGRVQAWGRSPRWKNTGNIAKVPSERGQHRRVAMALQCYPCMLCQESVSGCAGGVASMDTHGFMKQLRDLHRQIAVASARLKATIAAADHEQEAKLRSEISRLLDEIDRISDLKAQRQIGGTT